MKFTVTIETIKKFKGGAIEALRLSWIHWCEIAKAKRSSISIPFNVSISSDNCACCKNIKYLRRDSRCMKYCPLGTSADMYGCCEGLWRRIPNNIQSEAVRDFIYDIYLQALVQEYGIERVLKKARK